MNALDSPLEVFLAADSLFTIVNSLWTWLAVIAAAALSLWRITSSPPPPSELVAPLITPPAELPAKSFESPPRTAARAFYSEGRTSGKFAVYYNADEATENNADVGGGDMDEEPPVRNDWEVSMKMRMWDDMGFRRYQDLTVLDGNVVRLWDGCSRRRNVIKAVVGGGGYEYNWSS